VVVVGMIWPAPKSIAKPSPATLPTVATTPIPDRHTLARDQATAAAQEFNAGEPVAIERIEPRVVVWVSPNCRPTKDGSYVYHYFEDCFHFRSSPHEPTVQGLRAEASDGKVAPP
jgi:hypothetical protein